MGIKTDIEHINRKIKDYCNRLKEEFKCYKLDTIKNLLQSKEGDKFHDPGDEYCTLTSKERNCYIYYHSLL